MPNPENKNTFDKGMNKDLVSYLMSPNQWSSAVNLSSNSVEGDVMTLSSEQGNSLCVTFPYTLIGAINLDGSQWIVFTTDNVNSEIGLIDVDQCSYTTLTGNQPCLNFSTSNLITGAARRNFDCGFNVYWSDGARNPDRVIDTNNVPWIQDCTTVSGCITCVNTTVIDCEKLRIAPHLIIPCVTLNRSKSAGTLPNGSYQVVIAYAVNSIKVTDYLIGSNPQAIFSHNNIAGAVTLTITGADTNFNEMLVTVVSYINGQLTAKKLGIFSTRETTIYINNIDPTLPSEDISLIPLRTIHIEKSDSIWNVGSYLLRNGLYEQPDFNYQPQANAIGSKWNLVEYDERYYKDGGNNYSYLGDEQYAFFIRWVYNTGDKSASYHIPGTATTFNPAWQTVNTATVTTIGGGTLPDGGVIIASGDMGYWESTDIYPDDKPSVWGALCGQPIRHHKFPDQTVSTFNSHFTDTKKIRILGVQFNNISHPLDINGNPITNIVGYEILRGSREGNKSIIAKGALNNLWQYDLPGSTQKGLFQNFPANDLRPNKYLTWQKLNFDQGGTNGNPDPLDTYRQDIFSFHSPDTSFQHPFLGSPTLKIYQELNGTSEGSFHEPYKHPLFKVATNFDSIIGDIVGLASVIGSFISILGGGYDVQLSPTQDIAWNFNLGANVNYPYDPTGATSTAVYTASIAYNTLIEAALAPFQISIVSEQIYRLIKGIIPGRQYALQFDAHAFYFQPIYNTGINRNVIDYQYVEGNVQTFVGFEVNNLFRNNYVALQLNGNLPNPTLQDQSRYTISQAPASLSKDTRITNTSCYYGGLKVSIPSQYGQIGSVREIPITTCVYNTVANTVDRFITPVLFGGDTYINRYTEKNPFFFFNDWLISVPEDFAYDYRNYANVPYPAFWLDNNQISAHFLNFASDFRRLDAQANSWSISTLFNSSPFYVASGFFYLFCNGVRDFYVESDVNIGYRDWGDEIPQRFYDPYGFTDLAYMFRSDYIKSDVYYKYDYSLSVNKFYTQYISFGDVLDRDYDPYLAYTCFDYFPRRVAYSLPQTEELKLDNWRQFLPNNFYDFPTPLRAIKSISKTGALFMMDEQSPVEFTGVQIFQSGDAGKTAITVGDGGLFNQPLQSVNNTDKNIGYGSCKSKYSVINTPHGLFWVSQKAGKVFQYTGQLQDISSQGLRWWFAKYLPSFLLSQFPNYPLNDNPVAGVGVHCSYDNTNDTLYISKKDYKAKAEFIDKILLADSQFYLIVDLVDTSIKVPIDIHDSTYFEDASWTVSYNCREKYWISFHSWHPSFSLSAYKHILTNIDNTLWAHNERCNLYSNYYGVSYPIELTFPINTQTTETTLKSVEYYLESYYYRDNCWDRTQLKDFNFTQMMVWNNEQFSGILDLVPKPVNPYDEIQYPIVGLTSNKVLYSLKEHKYRVNQFYDVTNNRGSLTEMFITDPNGYTFSINPLYTDPFKPETQRKKFRNYNNSVYLKLQESATNQINFRLTTQQYQISPR